MTTNAIKLQGTLREDGTLVLDEKPNLPPGRVKVIVQPADSGKGESNDVIAVLQQIHAAQALRGYVPPSVEEINGYLADMRDDDERTRLMEQIQEECRRQRV
ncbi:MAG: hypothetical protein JO112_20410 [Planctomycetes bacterium]|nr:hypothetical protein [Planctomycetota bacterium]